MNNVESALPPAPAPPLNPGPSLDKARSLAAAGQWRLTWRRFRRHRLAMICGVIILAFYLVAAFAEFFATTDPNRPSAQVSLVPPQQIHWFDDGALRPYVNRMERKRDASFNLVYTPNPAAKIPVTFFAHGFDWKLFGLIPTDRHLIGVQGADAGKTLFVLGTDVQGRDLWSRIVYATRVSLTVGLTGVAMSLALGVLLGGVSGLYGGVIDECIQRVIEVVRSVPTIPLWMGLAAAVPRDWSVTQVYFSITIIISLVSWTELARVVRGRFLALREEDFIVSAELDGCSKLRIIFRHMVPSFLSHIIAVTTLTLPVMVLSETALSFLGLGLRPPAISWGVLLQAAQNVQAVAVTPWLLLPAVPVIVAVLAFNFLGDGLRDAADPYARA
ncbi:MAG: binding-protein-dependent transport system inner rane component [Rhodopila sp.]|jgi:peptide/nickel transport system permease protein|nr:binding-protein-dependent transport system inner rane component [Rhodopila sp.]